MFSFWKRWLDRRLAAKRLRRLGKPISRPILEVPECSYRIRGDSAMIRETFDRR
jgi:hypothetical protein